MNFAIKLKYNIKNNEKIRLLACVLSGFFSSIPFFFEKLYIIEWFSFLPLFCVVFSDKKTLPRNSFLYGFVFHFSRSVLVLSWFKELYSMQSLSISPFLMICIIVVAIIGLSAVLAVPFGISTLIIKRYIKNGHNLYIIPILSSVLFTGSELINTLFQQIGLAGFPWVQTYISQVKFTFGIQTSALFGAHFITFLIILFNCFISLSLTKNTKVQKICLILPFILFTLNFFYGIISVAQSKSSTDTINACAYQDNNSSYSKWNLSSKDICDGFIADMENAFSSDNMPELIVLSETVFPTTINNSPNGAYIRNSLCSFTQKYENTVVAGGFFKDSGEIYNAQFVFENGRMLDTVYKKRSLVPFGEYIPLKNFSVTLFPFIENFNLSGNEIAKSADTNVVSTSAGNLGGLICYDSIFYYNACESVKDGAEIFILSTNDSWYNDSSAAYHHYSQGVFRAVETNKPVIRSATTGFSGVIDAKGRTLDKTQLLNKGIANAKISKNTDKTIFVSFGYLWYYGLCTVMLLFIIFSEIKRRKL